jgi:hypothetical protein
MQCKCHGFTHQYRLNRLQEKLLKRIDKGIEVARFVKNGAFPSFIDINDLQCPDINKKSLIFRPDIHQYSPQIPKKIRFSLLQFFSIFIFPDLAKYD